MSGTATVRRTRKAAPDAPKPELKIVDGASGEDVTPTAPVVNLGAAFASAGEKTEAARKVAGVKPAKVQTPKGPSKNELKRQLADRVVAAIGAIEMTEDEAKTVSQWIHHLPVNRENWPASLPTPDRSNWK
jgi:hypothetical protein